MEYKDNLFEEIKRALYLLKSKNIEKISQIFEKFTAKWLNHSYSYSFNIFCLKIKDNLDKRS